VSPVAPAVLAAAATAVLIGLPELPATARLGGPAGSGAPPPGLRRLPGWSAALLAAALLGVLSGPAAGAGAGVLTLVGRRAWAARQDRGSRDQERAGAVEALSVLASDLRAGRPPESALAAAAGVAVGSVAHLLQAAADAGRVGADPAAVLGQGAAGSVAPDLLAGLAACWEVCSSTGSSLAAAVDRLSEALRAEQAQRQAVDAELAGPRATAVLLAVLPVAGIGLAAALGARPLHVLLHTALGGGCLALGIGLDLVGLWWTGRLVAAAGGG
jgi:tight adherence protein B